jgi:hypothetical protein
MVILTNQSELFIYLACGWLKGQASSTDPWVFSNNLSFTIIDYPLMYDGSFYNVGINGDLGTEIYMNCHGCVGSINVCSNESPCLFPGKKIIL